MHRSGQAAAAVDMFKTGEIIMTKFDAIGRTVAAALCTVVFSGMCLLGAVGPAQSNGGHADVSAARTVA